MPSPVPSPPPFVQSRGLPPVAPSAAGAASSSAVSLVTAAGSSAAGAAAEGAAAGSGGVGGARRSVLAGQTAAVAAGGGPFAAAAQQRSAALAAAAAVPGPSSSAGADVAAGHPRHVASGVQEGAAAASVEGVRLAADAQQWQEALESAQAATSSSSSSAGYEIPDSVMKAGWGGVTQQQPWQPHLYPQIPGQQEGPTVAADLQQQQQQQVQRQASPAVRQWSSGVLGEEEGEFVEQPSDPEDLGGAIAAAGTSGSRGLVGQLLSGSAGGSGAVEQKSGGLQRASPASSSSEDAVLLERE